MSSYGVGAKVVHPCYGAGTIIRIQEKRIGDAAGTYYVIETASRGMQVMVPVARADEVGLRHVGCEKDFRGLLARCEHAPGGEEIESDLRTRQNDMREELKSGSFRTVTDIARVLYCLNNRRPLGTVDRQLLNQARDLMAGELALAADVSFDSARSDIDALLARMNVDAE